MRNRKKQKEMRKIREAQLAMRDSCGIKDPTPYYAVKNIINEEKAKAGKEGAA